MSSLFDHYDLPLVIAHQQSSAAEQSWQIHLPATGRELFTPTELVAARLYRVTFSGRFTYQFGLFGTIFHGRHSVCADALFYSDDEDNIRAPYFGLLISDRKAGKIGEDWQYDRATSVYSFLYRASEPGRLSFRLHAPIGEPLLFEDKFIVVRIELLPASAMTQREQKRADVEAAKARQRAGEIADAEARTAKKAAEEASRNQEQELRAQEQLRQKEQERQAIILRQKQAEEERRKAEQEHVKRQSLQEKKEISEHVEELKRMVHQGRNMFDPAFRRAFVVKNQADIRGNLGKAWSADYDALMADKPLVRALKKRAPEVLAFYERRLEMAMEAERLDVMPTHQGGNRVPLTPHSEESLRELVSELYRLRDTHDKLERAPLSSPNPAMLNQYSGAIATGLKQMAKYGIAADSPEKAEQQLERLARARAVKTCYDEVREKLKNGESVGLDILAARAKDLFAEQCVLITQRRRAIRKKQYQDQREFDERLQRSRGEFGELVDVLREQGFQIEFNRQHEENLEEGLLRLFESKQRTKQMLLQMGESEAAEAVDNLYAEQAARLFRPQDEDYA